MGETKRPRNAETSYRTFSANGKTSRSTDLPPMELPMGDGRVGITWRFIEDRPILEQYESTKRALRTCSACDCEDQALVEVTAPHGRHGQWTRALCRVHLAAYRSGVPASRLRP